MVGVGKDQVEDQERKRGKVIGEEGPTRTRVTRSTSGASGETGTRSTTVPTFRIRSTYVPPSVGGEEAQKSPGGTGEIYFSSSNGEKRTQRSRRKTKKYE